ncbi:MAG: calcium/proton exchanger [Anaerolineae bacterium]|jgi:Ca2+:H+ antiporter
MRLLNVLLIFGVVAIVAELAGWSPLLVFVSSGLAMIPLAGLMGEATEVLAVHTGPRVGGLLNATLGNAAELIITIMAIREGIANPAINAQMLELVRASLTGSILGNILLVMGLAILVGGARHGIQRFDPRHAGLNATMLLLGVAAFVIPSLFSHSIELVNHDAVEYLSLGVAGVMILLYGLAMLYQLRSRRDPHEEEAEVAAAEAAPHWSVPVSIIVLVVATVAIVVMSELLVGTVEHVVLEIGITEFFLGIIIVPLIGNVAEHLVAVQVAAKNKMELSLAISVGSSLQIALFVAPLLVFVSLLMGNPLTLVLNQFELIALMAAVLIAAMVSLDGESNWLEGAMLLAIYAIIALAFFWLPS